MKFNKILSLLAVAALMGAVSCNEDNGVVEGPSDASFFSQETLAYNLTSNPEITIPVVRLGKTGALNVNVATTGSSQFSVPASVTIEDGNRIGELKVTYDPSALTFNEQYNLEVTISDFKSIYGYKTAKIIIEYPTSYKEYGSGTIEEGWWGETEDKVMYVRDYAANVYQCYLPDCWGHDSGAGYPVQDYVFFWNTATNKLYIPIQAMGCEDWCIGDQGSIASRFGGPDYKEGSADWMNYIDGVYSKLGQTQPYYDPDKKAFYLSDSAAISPADGSVAYGTPGTFDVFFLK